MLGLDKSILNKDTILHELDEESINDMLISLQSLQSLLSPPTCSFLKHGRFMFVHSKLFKERIGAHRSPSVEYLFVEPYSSKIIYKNYLGLNLRPFGHAAVRYTIPGTTQSVIVNISKEKGKKLVEFHDPKEWLFGIDDASYEQGGIYSRHIIGLRIESLPPILVQSMHLYFQSLAVASDSMEAGFITGCATFSNSLKKFFSVFKVKAKERGNCARWTSKGLVKCGLLKRHKTFPKEILLDIWERHKVQNQMNSSFGNNVSNCHLIFYERAATAYHRWGIQYENGHAFSLVTLTPWGLWKSFKYKDMHKLADYVVSVDMNDFARIICKEMIPVNYIRGCFG